MPEQRENGEPYTTQSLVGVNLQSMERKVYCEHCKYYIQTNLPGAKCGICHSNLINVVKSHFTNELA